MTDMRLGMLIVAVGFGGIVAYGLVTGTMLLPPYMCYERDERPFSFWLAAVENTALAALAFWVAFL